MRLDVKAQTSDHERGNELESALSVRNLALLGRILATAALRRTESRGAHFREDYQAKDAAAGKVNTVVWRGPDGTMQLRRMPIPPMPEYLQHVIEEMK